jgi:lipopolysaccharide/colanic/teichoic acid biosynthesis glycosyltransferase
MELMILNQYRVYPRRTEYQNAKRAVDIVLCLVLFPVVLPLLLLSALAILVDSGRPVVFLQERIGKGGRHIRIYKFRTMKADIEQSNNHAFMKAFVRGEITQNKTGNGTFKPLTDNQITRVGRILRRISLDELPQMINVLKGEMSIVGPRPNVTWEVDEYHPWHFERLEVLPGITGLAQVQGRSSISFNSIVRYDINYIERQNLALDLKIIWWTIKSVFLSKGAE